MKSDKIAVFGQVRIELTAFWEVEEIDAGLHTRCGVVK